MKVSSKFILHNSSISCLVWLVKGLCSVVRQGGIGSRGPGESQLELNRRSVRNQITDIERQLKVVEKNRATVREKRLESSTFKIGLIGYTNAGKSTIMNTLTSKTQYEADELFATLDATTKSIHLGGNLQVTLTDTVGFIQDLPTELVSSFSQPWKKASMWTFWFMLSMLAILTMRNMKKQFCLS